MPTVQYKLQICSLSLATKVADGVSAYGDNGKDFSATDRLNAINRGRGTVYTQILMKLGAQAFIAQYPEFIGIDTGFVVANRGTYSKVRKIIKLATSLLTIEPVPEEHFLDAKFNPYSKWKGTASKPRFIEYMGSSGMVVEILDSSQSPPSTVTALYLAQPVDITAIADNGADLIEPYAWLDMIVDEAMKVLLTSQQVA